MARRVARAGYDIERVLSNPKFGRCVREHPRECSARRGSECRWSQFSRAATRRVYAIAHIRMMKRSGEMREASIAERTTSARPRYRRNCVLSHTKGCCRCNRTASTPRIGQAIFIANLGIFAPLLAMLLWIYLRVAVFSQDVREILLTHSLRYASVYYAFSVVSNEWKARVPKCRTS